MTVTPLAFEDAFEVLGPALSGDNVVLVGGQAVNYWLSYYRKRDATLAQFEVVTSDDVDFFGSADAAALVAKAIAGEMKTVALDDDHSPNTAIVDFRDSAGRAPH